MLTTRLSNASLGRKQTLRSSAKRMTSLYRSSPSSGRVRTSPQVWHKRDSSSSLSWLRKPNSILWEAKTNKVLTSQTKQTGEVIKAQKDLRMVVPLDSSTKTSQTSKASSWVWSTNTSMRTQAWTTQWEGRFPSRLEVAQSKNSKSKVARKVSCFIRWLQLNRRLEPARWRFKTCSVSLSLSSS